MWLKASRILDPPVCVGGGLLYIENKKGLRIPHHEKRLYHVTRLWHVMTVSTDLKIRCRLKDPHIFSNLLNIRINRYATLAYIGSSQTETIRPKQNRNGINSRCNTVGPNNMHSLANEKKSNFPKTFTWPPPSFLSHTLTP